MDLLEKFEIITIETDNRISEADSEFCQQHQNAYESAVRAFQELIFFWKDIEAVQREHLCQPDGSATAYKQYICIKDHIDLYPIKIRTHIGEMHRTFIHTLVRYFNQTYHMSVSEETIMEALIPPEPKGNKKIYKEEWQQYREQITELILRYGSIVDHIILQLDGRSFAQQAFYELSGKCHEAAWGSRTRERKYERKKSTISISDCCSYSYVCRTESWELQKKAKSVIWGLAHFETGCYDECPPGMSELVGGEKLKSDHVEFPTCTKVSRIRMFKNGRVDIRFTSEEYAEQFAETYLGTVC